MEPLGGRAQSGRSESLGRFGKVTRIGVMKPLWTNFVGFVARQKLNNDTCARCGRMWVRGRGRVAQGRMVAIG